MIAYMEFQINSHLRAFETVYIVKEVNSEPSSADTTILEVVKNKSSAHAILWIYFLVLAVVVASFSFHLLKQGKKTTVVNDLVHVKPKHTARPRHTKTGSQNLPTNTDMSTPFRCCIVKQLGSTTVDNC